MNMSYCMFENTLQDLQQCVDNWEGDEQEDEETAPAMNGGLSKREQKKKEELIELCRYIVEELCDDDDV